MTQVTLRHHTHTLFILILPLTTSHFQSIRFKRSPVRPKQTLPAEMCLFYFMRRYERRLQGCSMMPARLSSGNTERSVIRLFDTVAGLAFLLPKTD